MVQPDETYHGLANRFGIDRDFLMKENKSKLLKSGDAIEVPIPIDKIEKL